MLTKQLTMLVWRASNIVFPAALHHSKFIQNGLRKITGLSEV